MKAYGWFKEVYDEAKDSFEFKLAGLKLDVTEKILKAMERKNVNRKQLSDLLGVSKASVSRLLNNGSNATLKTLLQIAEALDCDLNISIRSKAETGESRAIQEGEIVGEACCDPLPFLPGMDFVKQEGEPAEARERAVEMVVVNEKGKSPPKRKKTAAER
jgi:transcriptional regulator with XRE-family HTH domain